MIKVFLVEDDILMREHIKKHINWEQHGLELVGEATDGELAYPMILETKPDIMITNIMIPFMNGLELSRLVKNEMPWIKILILSDYDKFEYAKTAIKIGVSDFLLKPVDAVTLINAIKAVKIIVEKEKNQQEYLKKFHQVQKESLLITRYNFFNDLIKGGVSISEIINRSYDLHIDLTAQLYNIILFKVSSKEPLSEVHSENIAAIEERIRVLSDNRNDIIYFNRGPEGIAFLLKGNDEEHILELTKEWLSKLLGIVTACTSIDYFGGIGSKVKRLKELPICFNTASHAFAYRYMLPHNQILGQENIERYQILNDEDIKLKSADIYKVDSKKIESFLYQGKLEEVPHFIKEYLISAGEKSLKSLIFRQYIVMDVQVVVNKFAEKMGGSGDKLQDKCTKFNQFNFLITSMVRTQKYLEDLLSSCIQLREEVSIKKYNKMIHQAKTYIFNHYMDEVISLNIVSAHVNLSPSHFSSIFSQETGQTFIEFLTGVRMEKARELLMCSNLKSSEIGYALGYKDSHYFSFLFKKVNGCTTKEFRMGWVKT